MAVYNAGIYGAGAYGIGEVTTADPPGPLVTLADVKAHLNIPSTYTADDLELTMHLEAATALIEEYVGPVLSRTVTQTMLSPVLAYRPVLSVTSVLSGTTPVTGYDLHEASGLLFNVPYGSVVTYTAGREAVPTAIKLAALETVKAGWRSQRGAQPVPAGGGADDGGFVPRASDELPPEALRWLRPYRLESGIA